jgi:hypothetical protein
MIPRCREPEITRGEEVPPSTSTIRPLRRPLSCEVLRPFGLTSNERIAGYLLRTAATPDGVLDTRTPRVASTFCASLRQEVPLPPLPASLNLVHREPRRHSRYGTPYIHTESPIIAPSFTSLHPHPHPHPHPPTTTHHPLTARCQPTAHSVRRPHSCRIPCRAYCLSRANSEKSYPPTQTYPVQLFHRHRNPFTSFSPFWSHNRNRDLCYPSISTRRCPTIHHHCTTLGLSKPNQAAA